MYHQLSMPLTDVTVRNVKPQHKIGTLYKADKIIGAVRCLESRRH
jgi:hypothetical protein